MRSTLYPDALLEIAIRQTGLTDFGEDGFREPLEILLQSLRGEARLSRLGTFIMHQTVLRLLINRLRTEKAFADDPAMNGIPIDRPLYILGFPRTGTTLLHNLLACDPNARWLHMWEGLYPAPAPKSLQDDARIERAEKWIANFEKAAPRLPIAHKLRARGPEECLWLMEHTFADLIFELRAYVPAYGEWLAAHEADVGIYRYYRRQLQMLGAHCRGQHWVLKAPRHLPGLAGLLAVFPDARIVRTHRDPAAILPSLCSLCEILHTAVSNRVDKHAIGAYWYRRMNGLSRQAHKIREEAKPGQFLDIHYEDLVNNPIDTVARIYDYHGYGYSGHFETNMRAWLAGNRQHKHGVHRYTLAEYGLEAANLKNDFSPSGGPVFSNG
uniref:Sulfotransferase family protein n=1 Tax=Candidatus Kentrum sp. FM TaxID=2126340 RepID=A0A450WXL6_9GAMM|nr:MAG: Sulfotransferase family protein [Candidatus Kentron sp. FM]VFJ75302.1 MAG: Sulfotransferase family protein [Candidatus Kentron sp. FM]VFK21784.1 MAG: Sulfotransferase family protein [Candidatus Kentron sp. FM]